MRHFLIAVEGVHDAALVGLLLRNLLLNKIEKSDEIVEIWDKLIPKTFPVRGMLTHVVKYPDLYVRLDPPMSAAVVVAGGQSTLIEELRSALEIINANDLSGVVLITDADDRPAIDVFNDLRSGIISLLEEMELNGFLKKEFIMPSEPGIVSKGNLGIGIYILPNNASTGTLETLLLESGRRVHADLCRPAEDLVKYLDESLPAGDKRLRKLRKGAGRHKASAAVVGNILFPGSSLSVAIEKGRWFDGDANEHESIIPIRSFFASLTE